MSSDKVTAVRLVNLIQQADIIDLIDILRIENDQFVENWAFNNTAEVMTAFVQNRPVSNLL